LHVNVITSTEQKEGREEAPDMRPRICKSLNCKVRKNHLISAQQETRNKARAKERQEEKQQNRFLTPAKTMVSQGGFDIRWD